MTQEFKKNTVSILLSEMLKKSRETNITKGQFWQLSDEYAERIVKLFAIPDVSNNEVSVCDFVGTSECDVCEYCHDCPILRNYAKQTDC
jgi:hypothetical protein